jgi:hypothetical protein
MANGQRGEVLVTVKRKKTREADGAVEWTDTEYTLKLSMNAAAALETRTKKKIGDYIALAGEMDFNAIRQLVWLLLQKYHASEFTTVDQAGEFVDDAGGPAVFFDALQRLQALNEPPAAPARDTAGGDAPDALDPPHAAPAGTGPNSTSQAVQ